jgi:hypothetical protein
MVLIFNLYQIERHGDVDIFALLEVIQILLKAQLESLQSFFNLPPSFEDTLKGIWVKWVSSFKINYKEEDLDSKETVGPGGGRLLDFDEISDLEDIEQNFDADSLRVKLPFSGRMSLSMTLLVIILACYYSNIPLHISDLYQLLTTGKIPYANLISLIPVDIQKRLKPSHLSMCKNPVIILFNKLSSCLGISFGPHIRL